LTERRCEKRDAIKEHGQISCAQEDLDQMKGGEPTWEEKETKISKKNRQPGIASRRGDEASLVPP